MDNPTLDFYYESIFIDRLCERPDVENIHSMLEEDAAYIQDALPENRQEYLEEYIKLRDEQLRLVGAYSFFLGLAASI